MLLLLVTTLSLGSASAQEQQPAGIAYDVVFTGDFDSGLRQLMRAASRLVGLRESPPQSEPALRQRMASDRERLATVLESEGYYEGGVEISLDRSGEERVVRIEVRPGPRYTIGNWRVVGLDDAQLEAIFRPEPLPVSDGAPARAPAVLEAERMLLRRLTESGYPFASSGDREVRIDESADSLDVTYQLEPGPAARFGPVSVQGNETVQESYLQLLVPWAEGDPFDQRMIEAYHERLADTGLFRSIRITHGNSLNQSGELPIDVVVEERSQRSLIAGANFSSDEGLGIELGWEHRNFFGRQQRFLADLRASQLRQSFTLQMRVPNYGRYDKDLLMDLTARRQDSDAFDEQSITATAALEREVNEWLRYSYGGSAEFAQIEENGRDETYTLFGGPLSAWLDITESLLNPTEGARLSLELTPYVGTFSQDVTFAVAEVGGSAYMPTALERVVLAGRFRLASIVGERTSQVPANKRLYAGGGGSVRGYEFQSLGPVDAQNDPRGGRSALELGFEPRITVTENIGVVPFIEGGTVFDDPLPERTADLRWAAGLGLRYYTPIGPLRFDFAVPLEKRSFDDDYAIYISIGQAF